MHEQNCCHLFHHVGLFSSAYGIFMVALTRQSQRHSSWS
jgi:hypothetical protein